MGCCMCCKAKKADKNAMQIFTRDPATGKLFGMLSPRDLCISWGDDNRYWQWIPMNDSSFKEVAKLSEVYWFEVKGEFVSKCLPPGAAYTVSFIIKPQDPDGSDGWDRHPVKFEIGTCCGHMKVSALFLKDRERLVDGYQMASFRHLDDGWIEFDAGEFVVEENEGCPKKVKFCMRNWEEGTWKGGLLLGGVKIQPSDVVKERKSISSG